MKWVRKFANKNLGLFRMISKVVNYLYPFNSLRGVYFEYFGVALLKKVKIKCKGTNNKIYIDDFSRLNNCKITIYGNNNKIHIGNHAYLNNVELHIEDEGNLIEIGQYGQICGKTHLAAIEGTSIKIGERCLFSSDIHFQTGDAHSILDLDGKRLNPSKDIVIGNHVWIGTKVTCLKNVIVSDNSIVAAMTALTRQYLEKNCIIAGVPGTIIKRNIDWSVSRIEVE